MDVFKEAKAKFPCVAQPKLDGVFCKVVVDENKCTLYTKSDNEIVAIPHINKAILDVFLSTGNTREISFNGELYNHYLTFQEIISIVKRKSLHENYIKMKFYGFDIPLDFVDNRDLYRVEGKVVENLGDLYEEYHKYLDQDYEGLIYRFDKEIKKLKPVHDAEYEVLEIIEGNGKLKGRAASMRCITKAGEKFKAKCKGDYPYLARILISQKEIIGKQVTVEYQNLTDRGVPRFGNVKAIRDYE